MKDKTVGNELGDAVDRLIEANITLWHEEDQRRDKTRSDSERLHAADEITVWNRKRNQTIDEINQILAARLADEKRPSQEISDSVRGSAILTGTLGDLVDRLAIAKIRYYHLAESDDPQKEASLARVSGEIEDLRRQIDQALALALSLPQEDRQRLLGFGKNKSYKDEDRYG